MSDRQALCSQFVPADRVRYVPGHARGDASHVDCLDGAVSSQNGHSVFVKFDKLVARLGWEGTTSQSCDPADLVKL